MIVNKGVKVRIYPTKEQKSLIEKTFGCARFAYNQTIEFSHEHKNETGEWPKDKQRNANLMALKSEYLWLREVDSTALQQSLRDFGSSIRNLAKNPKHFNKPKFKSKRGKLSYRTPFNNGAASVKDDYHLKLPKLGIVATSYINVPSNYKNLSTTISRTKSGKYFATILVECEVDALPKTGKAVGLDLGLEHLLISSDGLKVENPRFLRKSLDKLKSAQRKLSKMKTKLEKAGREPHECKNFQKQLHIVRKLHEKVANQRRDFAHKLSKQIVENYDFIGMEDLNVEGMKKNRPLAFSISDVSWSQLTSFIEYKCAWYGKRLVKIDRFFPSSKTCNDCGAINKELTLADREWACQECGVIHDRDINAAKNILNEALAVA